MVQQAGQAGFSLPLRHTQCSLTESFSMSATSRNTRFSSREASKVARRPVSTATATAVRPEWTADSSGFHRQHGPAGLEEDLLGVAAEDELADAGPPPQPDDDH
jgi:hypothetical protein